MRRRRRIPRLPPRAVALVVFTTLSMGTGVLALAMGWVTPETLQRAAVDAGPWGMAVFVLVDVVAQLLWIPRAWGLVAAGLLYGPLFGALVATTADMTSAAICYAIARGGGRAWVRRLLEDRPRAARTVAMLAERRGGLTVCILRMMPVAHYTLVSYAAGLAGVRFIPFMVGNAVGLLPWAFLYPTLANAALEPWSPTFLGLASLLVVTFLLSAWWARRFFKKQ